MDERRGVNNPGRRGTDRARPGWLVILIPRLIRLIIQILKELGIISLLSHATIAEEPEKKTTSKEKD